MKMIVQGEPFARVHHRPGVCRAFNWRAHRLSFLKAMLVIAMLSHFMFATNVWAQARITFDLSRPPTPLMAVPLDQTQAWLGRLRLPESAPNDLRTVLDMSERAARMVLTVAPGPLIGVHAFTMNNEDLLLAAWHLDEASGPSTLAIWDRPYATAFVLIWNRAPFSNAQQVEAFTQNILSDRSYLSNAEILMSWDEKHAELHGSGTPTVVPNREPIQILGAPGPGDTYTYALTVGKRLISAAYYTGDPSDFLYVPERFPPLRERVGGWPTEQLIRELEGGTAHLAANRDGILLRELFRRGLSDGQFRKLFDSRVENVMHVLVTLQAEAHYADGLRAVLSAQTPGDPRGDDTVRIILRYLRSCADVDIRDIISHFLQRGAFTPWTFGYMEMRGDSLEDYEAVERAPVPEGSPAAKLSRETALAAIRKRVHPR